MQPTWSLDTSAVGDNRARASLSGHLYTDKIKAFCLSFDALDARIYPWCQQGETCGLTLALFLAFFMS